MREANALVGCQIKLLKQFISQSLEEIGDEEVDSEIYLELMAANKDLIDLLDTDMETLLFSELERQEMTSVGSVMKLGLLH